MKLETRLGKLEDKRASMRQRIPIVDHEAVERLALSQVAGGCSEADWNAALIHAQEELKTPILIRNSADWNL